MQEREETRATPPLLPTAELLPDTEMVMQLVSAIKYNRWFEEWAVFVSEV